MKRWEKQVESYLNQCRMRDLAESTLVNRNRELDRLWRWLRNRHPQPKLEEISLEMLSRYIGWRRALRAKARYFQQSPTSAVVI